MNAVSTALAVLGLLIGVAILAVALFIGLFFTLVYTRSQDGPVMWDRLGYCLICLAVPGTFLIVISSDYLRHRNLLKKAEED